MSTRPRLPIWARAEPTCRQPRLTRSLITETALQVADGEGFGSVTMRRVAERLGVAPMSLYHYLEGRADLIALMDDALMEEALVPEGDLPEEWHEALLTIARRTREMILKHPWALAALHGAGASQPPPLGPGGMRHFEQSLAALAGAPLTTAEKLDLLGVVDAFVFGHAMNSAEVQLRYKADPVEAAALMEYGLAQLTTARYPEMARLAAEPEGASIAVPSKQDEVFERGLRWLLEGMAASMGSGERTGGRSGRSTAGGARGGSRAARRHLF